MEKGLVMVLTRGVMIKQLLLDKCFRWHAIIDLRGDVVNESRVVII